MPSTFEQQLKDPSVSFVHDPSPGATSLLIAFGGIKLGLGMPPFEFFQLARDIPVHKIFVRDIRQAWYQRSLPGLGNTIPQITASLQAHKDRHGVTNIVAVGNSMGGFAAMLFGALLGAHHILAFSPQSFLAPALLWRHRDFRWKWNRLRAVLARQTQFHDVRPLLSQYSNPHCDLFYSRDNALDALHARHLEGLPNVKLHERTEGGHRMIKTLRDTGELRDLLSSALSH